MRVLWVSGAAHVERWAQQMRSLGMSQHTVRLRTSAVAACSTWAGVDPVRLTRDDVLWWLQSDPAWAPNTRNAYWRSLRGWFAWCVESGLIETHPLIGVKGPAPQAGRPRPVTTDELSRMVAAAGDDDTRAMMLLAAYQGLRVSEIAALRGEDFRGSTMRVRSKGGRLHVLPVHPQVAALAATRPPTGWWFPSPGAAGGHVTPKTVSKKVSAVMRRVGVMDGSAHRLRHWFGTEALRQSRNIRTVQELLRHADLSATQIYTRVDDAELAATVCSLPDLSA